MSGIQIADLNQNASKSKIEELSDRDTKAIFGGNEIISDTNVSVEVNNIFQINTNINVQIAINGDNFNLADLSNHVEALQS